MKDRKLATRYARALLAVLPDPSSAASADDFLSALAEAMGTHEGLRDVLLNPATPISTRKSVLAALAESEGASTLVKNFLNTVADHGRLSALPTMAAIYREEREALQGVVAATVTTAMALPNDLESRVVSSLERISGRKVRLTMRVDAALLGGVVSQVGSNVFDGSVRTQLNRLHHRMAEE